MHGGERGPRSWSSETTPLTFEGVVASLKQVVGQNISLVVRDATGRRLVEAYGQLQEPFEGDDGRLVCPLGEGSACVRLEADRAAGGSRASLDGGDYWWIAINQGDLQIQVFEDAHRPPANNSRGVSSAPP